MKKKKKPFWKQLGPEAEHLSAHLGNIVNNSRISDFIDLGLILSCAYYGYEQTHDHWGALTGALGYKLATNPGGGLWNSS